MLENCFIPESRGRPGMQIIFKYCMRFACSTLSSNFNTFRLFEKRNEAENEGMVLDTVFCLPASLEINQIRKLSSRKSKFPFVAWERLHQYPRYQCVTCVVF